VAYAEALREFLRRYPWVRLITPWNEPNHRSQPTAADPRLAAAYYNAARSVCGDCVLVAGDVLDAPNMATWLREYKGALDETPAVWGLHNYYDATYFRTSGIETMMQLVEGEIWLTETGGIVFFRAEDGRVAQAYDERRAEASVAFSFAMAKMYAARVTRVYLYQWRSPVGANFDAGLLSPDGAPRPAFYTVRSEVGVRPGSGGLEDPGASTARLSAARPSFLAVRVSRRGRLRVPVVCPRGAASACEGRLSIEGVDYRNATLINGHLPGSVLPHKTRPFRISPGRRTKLAFAVPRRVMRHAAHGRRRLRLSFLEDAGSARATEYVIELPKQVARR
jgi:hypothetical protein